MYLSGLAPVSRKIVSLETNLSSPITMATIVFSMLKSLEDLRYFELPPQLPIQLFSDRLPFITAGQILFLDTSFSRVFHEISCAIWNGKERLHVNIKNCFFAFFISNFFIMTTTTITDLCLLNAVNRVFLVISSTYSAYDWVKCIV